MRVLIVTKLFPNRAQPLASAFNRQQFAALAEKCQVVDIIAPLPWFPAAGALRRWTDAGRVTSVPATDVIAGLPVRHPRILHVPVVGRSASAALTAGSLLPVVRRYRGKIDVILAAWAFPHGVAGIALSRLLRVPCVVKLHGSDINVVADLRGPRAQLRWLLPRAERIVAVSNALAERAHELGVPRERIDVVYNGVDSELFFPRNRREERERLGRSEDERLILYVGWLLESKGVMELAEAFEKIAPKDPKLRLVLVGDGPAREALAARLGSHHQVTFAGATPLEEVAQWIGACDVLTLPSWNEGTPNVVLEALASGRKVVATDVGGIPDLITDESLGELVAVRDAGNLAEALYRTATGDYDADDVARRGSRGSWSQSADDLLASLERACGGPR